MDLKNIRKKKTAKKGKNVGQVKDESRKQESRETVCYFADTVPLTVPQIDVLLLAHISSLSLCSGYAESWPETGTEHLVRQGQPRGA